jgi:hypothetical protein
MRYRVTGLSLALQSGAAERAHWDEYIQAYDDAIAPSPSGRLVRYSVDYKHVLQAMAARHRRRHHRVTRPAMADRLG